MKNYFFYSISLILLFTIILNSQTITGKLVDENGGGIAGVRLQLYTSTNVYEDSSSSDGTFSFNIITGVEADNQLPTGYLVSDNFPNPFNPRTRINVTLPSRENVKVEVFNLLGQSAADVIKQTFDAGTNNIDIELNGLPNGFYISRITIGDKYTVVKKLMLIYGSQHLITNGSTNSVQLNKPNNIYLDTSLDSLVATSLIIGRKTFTSLPNFVSGTLDLGNLTIERYCPGTPTVLYEGKTYHTVQIGNQCWLKENLDVGTMINGGTQADSMRNNGILEKYCYNDDPANCITYGGLYQWKEAMQYVTDEGAQGICPTGWHFPTISELHTLNSTVDSSGNALKEIGQGTGGGAGTNTSGFSAFLAGDRMYNGSFTNLGDFGIFWSSTDTSATIVNYLYLYFNDSNIYMNYITKGGGYSVRCLKGAGTVPPAPILKSPADGANVGIPAAVSWYPSNRTTSYILQVSTTNTFNTFIFNENIGNVLIYPVNGLNYSNQYYWRVYAVNSYGTSDPSSIWSFTTVVGGTPCPGIPTITDPRDGKVYNTVLIGTQCWLKENMGIGTMIDSLQDQTNNGVIEKYCYKNDPNNCAIYGGLYQWDESMQYVTNEGAQGICPTGWHIPRLSEFETLSSAFGGDGNALKEIGQGTGGGAGTNTSGFSALLAGDRIYWGSFGDLGNGALFWSSWGEPVAPNAYYLYLISSDSSIYMGWIYKTYGFSVRCEQD